MKIFNKPEWVFVLVFGIWLTGMAYFTHVSVQNPGFTYKHRVDTVLIKHMRVDIPITISIYQPDSSQCWGDPFITANNSHITDESYYYWIAVSRDLMYYFVNFNDIIEVQKGGITYKFIVKDLMPSNWVRKIDILIPNGDWSKMINDKNNKLYIWFKNQDKAKIINIKSYVK